MNRITRHHRIAALLAALFALTLLLAACGVDDDDEVVEDPAADEPDEEPDEEPEEEPDEEPDEQVTLTFWDNEQAEGELSENQQVAVDQFEEENPDITVEITTVPYDEYQQRLSLAVEGGDPPDIASIDQIWMAQFADDGAFTSLDDFIADSDAVDEANFFPGAWESAIWDDTVFGVPYNVDVWQFTFYNAEMLDEAGVDPAQLETWEGLAEAGEALTGDGQYGVGLFGFAYESLVTVMNSFVFSNDGDILAEDGSCALDEPEAIEALEYMASLQEYAPSGILGNQNEDMRELFLNESLATEWWPAFEQATLADAPFDWGMVAGTAPEGMDPVGTYGGWNLAVFSDAEEPEAAWRFIEFMTDPEINPLVVDLIPANVEAAEPFLEERGEAELVFEHLDNARPRPLAVNYLEIAEIQMSMMQAIFDGEGVEESVQDACEQIEAQS